MCVSFREKNFASINDSLAKIIDNDADQAISPRKSIQNIVLI